MAMFPKPKRVENPEILERVRNTPCIQCGQWPSDPHHITTRKAGGGDHGDNVMPLCRKHHVEWHFIGVLTMTNKYPKIKKWLTIHERWDVVMPANKMTPIKS